MRLAIGRTRPSQIPADKRDEPLGRVMCLARRISKMKLLRCPAALLRVIIIFHCVRLEMVLNGKIPFNDMMPGTR